MHRIVVVALVAAAIGGPALAGPERVAFPEGYQTRFTVYGIVDQPDRKLVRFLYVNSEAAAKAEPGKPVPDGTVLVMEDRKARLGADGNPMTGPEGRLLWTDEVTGVFVQEKRAGWGAEYPAEKRNGEWEYASFAPAGARRTDKEGRIAATDACFACHKPWVAADHTFFFSSYVAQTRK